MAQLEQSRAGRENVAAVARQPLVAWWVVASEGSDPEPCFAAPIFERAAHRPRPSAAWAQPPDPYTVALLRATAVPLERRWHALSGGTPYAAAWAAVAEHLCDRRALNPPLLRATLGYLYHKTAGSLMPWARNAAIDLSIMSPTTLDTTRIDSGYFWDAHIGLQKHVRQQLDCIVDAAHHRSNVTLTDAVAAWRALVDAAADGICPAPHACPHVL